MQWDLLWREKGWVRSVGRNTTIKDSGKDKTPVAHDNASVILITG